MSPYHIYMHKNCMDICFEVMSSYEISDDLYVIAGTWWNLGYVGDPYSISIEPEIIRIRNPKEWIDITDRTTNIRTKSGLP